MASLRGHLHLVAARDADGRTYLRQQSFCAPFHLSKPHHDAGALVVNAVNPTAGVFAGDEIEVRAEVESGARLLLTAPSAQRIHAMNGGEATVTQEFRVAAGGFFESWPELLIPQRGARLRQRTIARVEDGGEMLLIETIAPGRVASGECFAFDRLDWTTEIHAGRLPHRPRALRPHPRESRARRRAPLVSHGLLRQHLRRLPPPCRRPRVDGRHPRPARPLRLDWLQRAGDRPATSSA